MSEVRKALEDHQKAFLLSCWLPSGTFRLAPKRDQINPYFTNLALVTLVRLKTWEPVQSHLDWYLQHLNQQGYINDYRLEGEVEVDTGSADSEDSYHSTCFNLAGRGSEPKQNPTDNWSYPFFQKPTKLLNSHRLTQNYT
ncbi:hypothetical protein [Brevibacillus sp. NRS-1366]|uniref:hypothetical protein n=1 Tax=Brevibacillus sp. NRS-1366 TaxID=3233899 RepID=UPI003D2327ED